MNSSYVYVEPQQELFEEQQRNLNLTWTYESFNEDELKLKLIFETPLNVSLLEKPDRIYFKSKYA